MGTRLNALLPADLLVYLWAPSCSLSTTSALTADTCGPSLSEEEEEEEEARPVPVQLLSVSLRCGQTPLALLPEHLWRLRFPFQQLDVLMVLRHLIATK